MLPTAAHMLDWMLNMILTVPIVMFRKGSIDLLSLYVKVQAPWNWVVIFFVGSLFVPFYYIYPLSNRQLKKRSRPIEVLVRRILVTIGSFLLLTYWKGVWGITDHFFDQYEWKGSLIGLVIVHFLMVFLQTASTLVFTPFFINCDERPNVLLPNNMFLTELSSEPKKLALFTLDALISHYINTTLVVLWFRHMFKTLTYLPIPQKNFGIIVILIGIGISFVFLLFEVPLAAGLEKIAKMEKRMTRNSVQERLVDRDEQTREEKIKMDTMLTMKDDTSEGSLHGSQSKLNVKSHDKDRKDIMSSAIKRKVLRYLSLTPNELARFVYIEMIFAVALFCLSMYWLGIIEVLKIPFPDEEQRTWFSFGMGWFFLICGQGLSSNGLIGVSHDLDFIYPKRNPGGSLHIYNNYIVRYFHTVYVRVDSQSERIGVWG